MPRSPGHSPLAATRALGLYDEAIGYYSKAQMAAPKNAAIYASLGFTHHLKGDSLHTAIGGSERAAFAGIPLAGLPLSLRPHVCQQDTTTKRWD